MRTAALQDRPIIQCLMLLEDDTANKLLVWGCNSESLALSSKHCVQGVHGISRLAMRIILAYMKSKYHDVGHRGCLRHSHQQDQPEGRGRNIQRFGPELASSLLCCKDSDHGSSIEDTIETGTALEQTDNLSSLKPSVLVTVHVPSYFIAADSEAQKGRS